MTKIGEHVHVTVTYNPEPAPTSTTGAPKPGATPGTTTSVTIDLPVASSQSSAELQVLASIGPNASPELLAELKALLRSGGVIQGEVGGFADSDFPLGNASGALTLSIELTPGEHQSLDVVTHQCADAARVPPRATAAAASSAFAGVAERIVARGGSLTGGDIEALLMFVMREAYIQNTLDLRDYADKVKFFNAQKKAIRSHLGELRKIRAGISCSEEEAATTRLDGSKAPAGGGKSELPKTADGGAPVIVDAAQRDREYPEAKVAIAEFTAFAIGSGETSLEKYLKANPDAKQRLLDAIPYMTADELVKVFGAFGGTDMVVADDLKALMGQMIGAMTEGQLLEIADKPSGLTALGDQSVAGIALTVLTGGLLSGGRRETTAVPISALGGDFGTAFTAALSQAKARVEADTGKTYASNAEAAAAWRASREEELKTAKRAEQGALDETILASVTELAEAKPEGPITTEDMINVINAAGDLDGRAASMELEDIKAFVEKNKDRLTPGALAAFEEYKKLAEANAAKGYSGIPTNEWDALIQSLDGMRTNPTYVKGDQDLVATYETKKANEQAENDKKAAAAAEQSARIADSLAYDPSTLDLDPSDGAIDRVTVTNDTPFIRGNGEKISTVAELDAEIKNLEEKLNTVGDDAQLANVDLQNSLQKQQQTLQTLSNISKMLHDTAMAIIRKIGG